ncbi:Yip1 family protein [Phenylobacterium sp.]|uniref:Yip1 family protein n=1 Tax=Phenylobacterium sp. TaxID=1871053 RepID=UPI00289D2140|nr:Yip1 family protein [Phenylobacterium sp.]
MSVVEPGTAASGLVERVKSILLKPAATWEVIDTETATIGDIFKRYVAILALIPAVAGLIGGVVFGYGAFGVTFKPSIIGALVGAIVSYGLTLLGVYVLALIIDALAPSFGGQRNRLQAFKVAAYAGTASWVAGIFQIYPPLAILGLLGLYSLYLLHAGLPRLMKTPAGKATPYTIAVIVAAIVLAIIVSVVTEPLRRIGSMGLAGAGALSSNTIQVGDKSVDLGKLEEASKRMEAAAKQIESGKAPEAVQPDVLKAYLPEGVAGYARTEVTTGSGGAAGISGSQAQGVYTKGEATIRLSVTDLGAAGALAGMASAFNMQSSSESNGKYEKIGKVDGRMTQESYDKASKHGQYSVLVGDRFMVAAEGEGASIDDLKSAVAAIGPAKLEALSKG